MSVFTSTLPDDLLLELAEKAKLLQVPKNKLIEKALRIYLNQITRLEYIKSYSRMNDDADIALLAEEGMEDYLRQIEE
ncbi:MAG: CopG family transcriptional regulator [Flavobacteriales bacterium]|nr:CopG family transcriptional regulator [Flavobacteriales bacterium]